MNYNSVILRYGEIGLKSDRNRKYFETLYLSAIKEALKNFKNIKIISYGKRFIIYHEESNQFIKLLKKIPGIQGFSPSFYFEFKTKQELIKEVFNQTQNLIKNKTFRITTKRVGHNHDFSSMDLAMEIGKELEPLSKGVDLNNPDINIHLEIRNNLCHIYYESFDGVGGLPPTSAGKVLALFSGGIDSPVAAYQFLKRGCTVDFIYINLLGDAPFNELAKVYNELINNYVYGYIPKLYVVNAEDLVEKLKSEVDGTLRQIFLKIIFYKISEIIANKNKYIAIVTGEAVSQKSSQTLLSLKVIDSQVNTMVLRPLIGMDKIEITKIAREIGTFSLSEKVKEYCNLSEGPVTTNPTLDVLKKLPDIENLIQEAIKNTIIFKGKLNIDETPKQEFKDAIIVDIRSEEKRKLKPINSEINIEYPEILHNFDKFSKDKKYIIVCDFGMKSLDVANKLSKKQINAIPKSIKEILKEPTHFCQR
ncbi:MAG: tRNA uracil 4-sulfurtransferase ThiI [Candidatus Woesearchaeota archaeon]